MSNFDSVNLNYSRRHRINLTSGSNAVCEVVSTIFSKYVKKRKEDGLRAVNDRYQTIFKSHLRMLILDLYSALEEDPNLFLGYSRGRENFRPGGCYWDPNANKALVIQRAFLEIIDFLSEIGLIENHIAEKGYGSLSSRMRALPSMARLFEDHGINWVHIEVDQRTPSIVVKDENKKLIPYPAGAEFDVEKAQENLNRINKNLRTSLINLNVTDEEFEEIRERLSVRQSLGREIVEYGEPVCFSNRNLRRIFANGSFDEGGRFYGGWWQGLPAEYRKYIVLEGCITVEMDFSNMQPSVMYSEVGHDAPKDSYEVPGWDPHLRKVIKKAFSQLINSDPSSQNENQWHRFAPDIIPDPMPENWIELNLAQQNKLRRQHFQERTGRDYSELLRELLEYHRPIKDYFFSKAWGRMQNIDSSIAERVMIKLLDHAPQITALPIHDSFIVRRGAEPALRNAMKESYREIVGTDCNVDRDVTVYDPPEDYVPKRLINAKDLFANAQKDLKERTGYYLRNSQWKSRWGLSGYE